VTPETDGSANPVRPLGQQGSMAVGNHTDITHQAQKIAPIQGDPADAALAVVEGDLPPKAGGW